MRVTVNDSGSPVGYDDYYPFGSVMDGRSNNSGNSNALYKFTGHELDQEAGLDLVHAGARNYDPELGRWLSVDPRADEYPEWTPYSYTLNNPIVNKDPDGEFVLSFLSGFARGIFSGESVGDSFNMGIQSVENSLNILSSFVQGNFRQIVSKFTWELPQQVVGVFLGNIPNYLGRIDNISHKDGATLINSGVWKSGAFTLGSIIQSPKGYGFSSSTIQHEYGHYIQSQITGPLYAIPAVFSWGSWGLDRSNIFPNYKHEDFPTEKWATKLGRNHFEYMIDSGTSSNFIRSNELFDFQLGPKLDSGGCPPIMCVDLEGILK